MKLNFFHNNKQNELESQLNESSDSDDIERPMGISDREWTKEMKDHFKGIRKTNPALYAKILIGH